MHHGFWRSTGYAQRDRHSQSYSRAFLQCAALGYAQTRCNSGAPRSHPMRLGSNRILENRVGKAVCEGPPGYPPIYLPETIFSLLLLVWYPSADLPKSINNRGWLQIFIYCEQLLPQRPLLAVDTEHICCTALPTSPLGTTEPHHSSWRRNQQVLSREGRLHGWFAFSNYFKNRTTFSIVASLETIAWCSRPGSPYTSSSLAKKPAHPNFSKHKSPQYIHT